MNYEEAVERFESLVARYGHVIRAAIRNVAGQSTALLGDDAEQQVLLELWKQVAKEQDIRYPSSYLYRAAVRETIRLVRKAQRRTEEVLEPMTLADTHPESQPDRLVASRELSARVRDVTRELSADRRVAVIAHLAGFSVHEIMAANEWSYNRARNLIVRGMADLRRLLKERYES